MFFKPEKTKRLELGASVITLFGGKVRELHGYAAKEAMKADIPQTDKEGNPLAGAVPTVSEPEPDVPETEGESQVRSEVVSKLVEVMGDMLNEGDEALFTQENEPRKAEVKKRMEEKFTSEEFDAAWELVEG